MVIYSPPKVGKSLLLLDLAVTISCGQEFLGSLPTRRYRVLYVDFENDPRGDVRTRLQAMGYAPDHLDHLDYLSFPTMAGFDTDRGSIELLAAVAAYGSEVVIIDTVSRAIDGEENSNDTWLNLYRRTGLKLKQAGVATIRLDHTGKDEAKGTRGGSAKSGDVDAIWRLTKITENRLRLECTESRMHLAAKSLLINRHTLPGSITPWNQWPRSATTRPRSWSWSGSARPTESPPTPTAMTCGPSPRGADSGWPRA